MNSVLERLPQGARVVVIRLRSLGDCVLTTPAIALLKAHRPDLRIAVVVEPRFAAVFEYNPDVDRILPPSPAKVALWRPRLCINFHGGTRSMLLTLATAPAIRAGWAHQRGAGLYNVRIPTAQEILGVDRKVHTAEHLASAIFYLGAPAREIPRAKLIAARTSRTDSYAVLHPFASHPDKRWPQERFAELARRLDLKPVILAGPGDDASPFADFEILQNAPLREVKMVLSGASLFVGNDSGPAHMAAAFGVPSVVLFGTSDPVIWAPWRTEAVVLQGLANLRVESVLEAAESLRVRP